MDHVLEQISQSNTPQPTPPYVAPVDTTSPHSPELNHLQNRYISATFLVIAFLTLVVGGWFGYVRLFSQSSKPKSDTSIVATESQNNNQASGLQSMSKYFDINQIRVGIPEGWRISISNKTDKMLSARVYPPSSDTTTTFAEIQIGSLSEVGDNSLLKFDTFETIEGLTVRVGNEQLLQSKRLVLQVEKTSVSAKGVITFYGNSKEIAQYRESIISMLQPAKESQATQQAGFVTKVIAQYAATASATPANVTIAGILQSEAKVIEIMEGPYPDRITKEDHPYKEGYAKLFKFEYLKGQRVEILAEENREDLNTVGSYISTELYYADGKDATEARNMMSGGTRISSEGEATLESGTYYVVVHTFGNKEGRFLLKVFDLDQVQDLFYAKFADGSEHLINRAESRISSNQEAVLLFRFTSPIEIVDDTKIRWFRKQDNGCISLCLGYYAFGDVTAPITVRVNQIETPIKITKLFMNQAIIQPADGGGFPVNSIINFSWDFGEDPKNPGSSTGYTNVFSTY
ncbi:MAG: hypothetical protein E6R05_03705 [Candidatus Moraniibacteriota bacterium]|nr:MAG: hypothetical protein E6R05_03705 [Candidatus Moranbacteria bacterium]